MAESYNRILEERASVRQRDNQQEGTDADTAD